MVGMTYWNISNLMSAIQRLSQFMNPLSSLATSSSSSSPSIVATVTPAEVNSIQERLLKDLSRLTRLLQRIQAVLHDAEEREIYDKSIQFWLKELREVAYDAEDVLDEYDYQVIKAQMEGMTVAEAEPSLKRKRVDDEDDDNDLYGYQVSLPSSTSIKIPISYNMAERIIKIIEKFDDITKDRKALKLREEDGIRRPSFDDAMKRPPSSSLVNDSDVFGREDEKKKIIQLLMSHSEKENTVIPIIGLGGVGKTTLAQLVYNDPMVCEHFSPKVWICVSEEFDVVRITKEIVTSIIGSSSHHDNNSLDALQCKLKEALLEKRFLLILDDIWNERPDIWEALSAPFSGAGMGKIIVTTRSMSVARLMQTVPPHELRCLDEEQSWLLFQRHAFRGWELHQLLNFEQIGREITKKCGGLPLALKAIGGFLRHEVEEQIWKDVLNNNLWELEETKNLILPALRISYNHMPGHLKPCFVYASLFPKDHEFEKVELIRMWIAQGYIQLTGRKRLLEDIAFEYFEDLQRRSFIQCSKSNKFILHDMVHDLALSLTRNEIHSLLGLDKLKSIPKDARHIFIKPDLAIYLMEVVKVTPKFSGAIRTFYSVLSYLDYHMTLHKSFIFKDSFHHFGYLRVLSINAHNYACELQFFNWIGNLNQLRYLLINVFSMQMEEDSLCSLYKLQTLELQSHKLNMFPRAMGKLINLRHLVLRCYDIKMLPKSIGQLANLITLDIEHCCELRKVPLAISKLTNMQHLRLPFANYLCTSDESYKKLIIKLQTLRFHYISKGGQHCDIGWLKHLVNLRGSLEIFELENLVNREDAKRANLKNKPDIESLTLSWTENRKDECIRQEEAVLDGLQPHTNLKELIIDGYAGNSFPDWFGNPHFSNLTKISLKFFHSNEGFKFLPLSGLPSLKSLHIKNIKGIRKMGRDFWCYNTPPDGRENNFIEVHVGFPSLEDLSISYMPEWEEWRTVKNGDFPSLKLLYISDCPNLELLPIFPSSLEELAVFYCHRLKHLALEDNSGPLSRLQKVRINNCRNLKSVNSLDNLLATLKFLKLSDCPLLQHNPDEYSHH